MPMPYFMRTKIIAISAVTFTVTLFITISSPKTAIDTAAMTVGNFTSDGKYLVVNTYADIVLPTMQPFPTLNLDRLPVIHTPVSTSSPQPDSTHSPTPRPSQTSRPSSTPASSTTISPGSSYTDQVIDLVNKERSKSNLQPLTKNSQLSTSAQSYAQYMADKNFFSHTGPDGSTFISRNKAAGYYPYRYLGENIAAGQKTPSDVISAWMGSSGHRANILKAEYREIGVGYVSKSGTDYGTYWAQEFGTK